MPSPTHLQLYLAKTPDVYETITLRQASLLPTFRLMDIESSPTSTLARLSVDDEYVDAAVLAFICSFMRHHDGCARPCLPTPLPLGYQKQVTFSDACALSDKNTPSISEWDIDAVESLVSTDMKLAIKTMNACASECIGIESLAHLLAARLSWSLRHCIAPSEIAGVFNTTEAQATPATV